MNENIPLDTANTSDVLAEKDPMALLIMHKAYCEVFGDEEEKTENNEIKEE